MGLDCCVLVVFIRGCALTRDFCKIQRNFVLMLVLDKNENYLLFLCFASFQGLCTASP